MNYMTNIVYEDAVKVMDRGQITIPIDMRKKLGLQPKSMLMIKLTSNNDLLIEPMVKKKESLADFLKSMTKDKKIYWTAKDSRRLNKIRKKSMERLKKLYE